MSFKIFSGFDNDLVRIVGNLEGVVTVCQILDVFLFPFFLRKSSFEEVVHSFCSAQKSIRFPVYFIKILRDVS